MNFYTFKCKKSSNIGRFCGYVYPPLLVSSSNHFKIVLICDGDEHNLIFEKVTLQFSFIIWPFPYNFLDLALKESDVKMLE